MNLLNKTLSWHQGWFSPKNSGRGIAPVSLFITESIFSVLRNRKKYELHIGLHLKSIMSRVANSVKWVGP